MDDKILMKVRKMLALANDAGATEGERDNALRMAHALLAKHNLTMASVKSHEQQEGRGEHFLETFGMKWCRNLAAAVGSLFFCKLLIDRKINGTKMRMSFIGKESNAITASILTEYLITSILKEARGLYKHNLSPETRAFGTGAANRIWARVQDMKRQPVVDEVTGTALVLVSLYKQEEANNEEWISKHFGTSLKKYGKQGQPVDISAYRAGHQFADGLNLNGLVANKNVKMLK